MNLPARDAVNQLTTAAGRGVVTNLLPLTGGANNRVYRVETTSGPAILKAYFRHPTDPRDRLGAETAFARYAWAVGVRCIPQLLAASPHDGLALFEFIDGQPLTEATEAVMEQASQFIRLVNAARWRPLAARLPTASEACFSLAEHLGTVAHRVERLTRQAEPPAQEFVRREVLPVWQRVVRSVTNRPASLHAVVPIPARCISPSDFGFHNALQQRDGSVYFLDFEYAGWDDPAKLICDFFCQPRVPVPLQQFDWFAEAIAANFPDSAAVVARARLLLPVYRVKWICIRLNEFLPADHRRRQFALAGDRLSERQAQQLVQARAALDEFERLTP